MIAAHLGPRLGRQGGPSGYLSQLARAFAEFGSGAHEIVMPAEAASHNGAIPRPAVPRLTAVLRRARRTWIGPAPVYRPGRAALERRNGSAHEFISTAWRATQSDAEASLSAALGRGSDVLFAHDAPTAEAAIARRTRQQVWLLLHNPMSLALYLTWCWGVPEWSWDEVASLPDVRRWTEREIGVINAADRIFIPCGEAIGELVRADERFAPALRRVELLMTGAIGPSRRWPAEPREVLRDRWGLPRNEPVGLFIGNAQPYRGLDVLFAALRELPSRRRLPGVMAIAGPPRDQMPLHSRIEALGPVAEIADLLAAADFVVNLNRFSLFDLSTIEALEAGSPLLMHAIGGNIAFHALGAGAVMLRELTAHSVAEGLTTMFAADANTMQSLSQQSRNAYETALTLRHLRDRHVAAYETVAVRQSTLAP